jgi:basic amino acid/polyamine antiporter, APA family
MTDSADVQSQPTLPRVLGAGQAWAVVVGTIIGSGIFLVPAEMMQAAGSARLVYLAWIVGGLLSLSGAVTYAELAALKPLAGGEYVFIRDAYGGLPAFLYAWTWFLIAKPASIATLATGFVRVLGTFPQLAFLSDNVPHAPVSWGQMLAIAAAVLITLLNYFGIKKAGEFQFVFTLLKVAIVLGIVWFGFGYKSGNWQHFAEVNPLAKGGFTGFMAALVATLWAYDGWNDVTMIAGEVKRPEKTLPFALVAGVGAVAVLYMLINAALQYVLPATAIAASARPAADAMVLVLGPRGAGLIAASMALSMLVSMNGPVMSGARVPFALARDGYFFSALGRVHPRFRTPSFALLAQLGLAAGLLLVGGGFRRFFSLAIFSEWLFYMLAASTIFVFRRRIPEAVRPYRAWGYPLLPALFLGAAAVLLGYSFAGNLLDSTLGTVAILAGIPFFYWFSQNRKD